jgi:hypothetical protein
MVLSCAVTSESVFGRLHTGQESSISMCYASRTYYFSTHGCSRFVSFFVTGAFEELVCAAAACRALTLKKSAMLWNATIEC